MSQLHVDRMEAAPAIVQSVPDWPAVLLPGWLPWVAAVLLAPLPGCPAALLLLAPLPLLPPVLVPGLPLLVLVPAPLLPVLLVPGLLELVLPPPPLEVLELAAPPPPAAVELLTAPPPPPAAVELLDEPGLLLLAVLLLAWLPPPDPADDEEDAPADGACSHSTPVKPLLHSHWKLANPSVQVPPLTHGPDAHSSMFCEHSGPE